MRARALARFVPLVLVAALPACTIDVGGGESPTPAASPTASPVSTPSPSGTGITEVVGSGNVVSESRQVAGFSRVRLRGSGNLLLSQTGAESLTIEAEDNILPLLRSDVENGVLILGLRPGASIIRHRPIVYRLTVSQLEGLEASGSGSAEITGLDTAQFELDASGSVEVRAEGRADTQRIILSGSGEFDGEMLRGRSATVEVSGSGEVVVNAGESLDVQVSGSGDVFYVGSPPQISQRVSGSGSVQRR